MKTTEGEGTVSMNIMNYLPSYSVTTLVIL